MKEFDITNPSSFLEMEIRESLRKVLDPELNINIVDLGLVYDIDVSDVNMLIVIKMTLSSKFCPMGDAILQSVKNHLEYSYGNYAIQVDLVWEPQWNYDSISEEGLKQLGR